MQQAIKQRKQSVGIKQTPLSRRIEELSEKVKIIRFGIVHETTGSPWDRLAGMFTTSRSVNIEEILDARGFEETALCL